MLKITSTNSKGLDEDFVIVGYDGKPTKKGILFLGLLTLEEILADTFIVYLIVKFIKSRK